MKKVLLVLAAFVPVLVGVVVNYTLAIPLIGSALFMLLPLLTTAFWVFLGWQYARTEWKALPAVLTANSLGILSLAVYLWQFFGYTDEARNLALAGASQMFSAAPPPGFWDGLPSCLKASPTMWAVLPWWGCRSWLWCI